MFVIKVNGTVIGKVTSNIITHLKHNVNKNAIIMQVWRNYVLFCTAFNKSFVTYELMRFFIRWANFTI